jgi:cation diffusion facilitator family transporter
MSSRRGLARYAQFGILANAGLAIIKGVAGVLGNSYALIADAVESSADIFASLIVWSGLRISARDPDEDYPFGYGKAEALAAIVVSLFLFGAAVGIAIEAAREIRTPHHAPAPYTLIVLVLVVIAKEGLFRRMLKAGTAADSTALAADAWHHRGDAITSAAAFVGISVALIGGPGWESADDWAALLAAVVILRTGVVALRPAVAELMDRAPAPGVRAIIEAAVRALPEVRSTHRLKVRRAGGTYFVDLHVQVDPAMSLHDAHIVSGKAKGAIRQALDPGTMVLVHMEPDEPAEDVVAEARDGGTPLTSST